MGILTRFKDIMSSNLNALLDKAEDPEKMIDQCLRTLNSDLGKVKAETAAIMAEEQRSKRNLDECTQEIDKYQSYAIKALQAGSEEDAKKFLEKKAELTSEQAALSTAYETARVNSNNMRTMHDKLIVDISQLESRRNTIKAKIAAAKTQERINQMNSSFDGANSSIAAFERYEEKADNALDRANAMAELNAGKDNDISDLAKKYDSTSSSSVDAELEALKASLNMK